MKKILSLLLLLFIVFHLSPVSAQSLSKQYKNKQVIHWSNLPDLPDSVGRAGGFAGTQGETILFAGGANFPEAPPWKDGPKVFHKQIYVLLQDSTGYYWYTNNTMQLPRPLAYGVSASTNKGLIIIGGTDGKKVSGLVFKIHWDAQNQTVHIEQLPDLPEPLAFMSGAKLNGDIYLAGGKNSMNGNKFTKAFYKLTLSPNPSWTQLPAWPGPKRGFAVADAQHFGNRLNFFLFSGRNYNTDGSVNLLSDAYRYDPLQNKWTQLSPIALDDKKQPTRCIMGAPSVSFGDAHILVFGGDMGQELKQRVHLSNKIDALKNMQNNSTTPSKLSTVTNQIQSLQHRLDSLAAHASSFSKDILAYHTITDTWDKVGTMPSVSPATTTAFKWQGDFIIPSGEIRPGIRTPKVLKGSLEPKKTRFGSLNYLTLGLYMLILLGMGFYFSKREKGTGDFFLGGKRVPWWAAGLSIYATQLSAITFLSVPAVAFATNWTVYIGYFAIFLMAPVVIYFYLPFFRRLNVTSAYEYLEKRFNLSVRIFGSISFILFQLGRMSIVVYLPALALTAIFGMNIYMAIILMGLLAMIYTAMGGIEAVIWTDVLQVIVLVSGIIYSILYIFADLGGILPLFHTALANHKFQLFNFNWSFTTLATWSVFLGTFALQFGPYTTDQAVIQRYLTTKDEKSAAQSIWTNGIISIPTGFLFFLLGTALYVFYKVHPEFISVGMQNDQVFPLFIGQHLPDGLTGFLIAGIFSASMSSLDSSMHSMATVITVDYYERFLPEASEQKRLRFARWTTILVGSLGTGMACILAIFPVQSLFFFFQEIIGLISSALAGIFILGIFTRRANAKGALIGAVASLMVLYAIKFHTPIQFYIYPLIGIPVCVIVGFLISTIYPAPRKDLENLTYRTLVKEAMTIND